MASGEEIGPDDLGLTHAPALEPADRARPESGAQRVAGSRTTERDALEDVLRVHGGSVSRTAEALGLSRQALYRRMERLGVSLERRPRS